MKKVNLITTAGLSVLLFAATSQVAGAGPWDRHDRDRERREPNCEVKVINDSDYEIYVMINDRNEGSVWKHSSETFKIYKWGSMKVEASAKSETAKEWIELRPNNERAEVTFKNDDFPGLKEKE